jgi:hypothetical protein
MSRYFVAAVAVAASVGFAKFAWEDHRIKSQTHARFHITRAEKSMRELDHWPEDIDNEIEIAVKKAELPEQLEAMTKAARHFSECSCDGYGEFAKDWINRAQRTIDSTAVVTTHQSHLDVTKQKFASKHVPAG